MFIISKCIKNSTKNVMTVTGIFVTGLLITTSIIYIKNNPTYKVALNGQTSGFVIENENTQSKIEAYKKLFKIEEKSTVTGRTYSINLNGNKTIEIDKKAEAEGVAKTLRSVNTSNVLTVADAEAAKKKEAEKSVEKVKVAKVTVKKVAKTTKKATKTVTKKTTNRSTTSRKKVTTTVKSTNSGYAFPVKGCSFKNISNKSYPSYSGHTGIDININVKGKSVVAVKDGVVITSKALKTKSGAYRSYGEYIMIKHSDGKVSLYAHLKAGSRRVQVGDKVTKGEVIGTVGSTGNSSGTHLHFEIRVNGKPVNPYKYL